MKDKSIRVSNRLGKIKWNQRSFLFSLRESLFEVGDLKVGSAIKVIIESSERENDLGYKSFTLIFTALLDACRKLIKESYQDVIDRKKNYSVKTAEFKLDINKSVSEFELTSDFFDNPTKQPLIQNFQPVYEKFLAKTIGLSDIESAELSHKLPSTFWKSLLEEWDKNEEAYQPISNYFKDNPLDKGWRQDQEKIKYYDQIRALYQEQLIDNDAIQLSEVYIEPNFAIHKRCLPRNEWENYKIRNNYAECDEEIDIHKYVNEFFLKREKLFHSESEKSQILLLFGYPGQGKTSFCYRLILDQIERSSSPDRDLAFIELAKISEDEDFLKAPFQVSETIIKKKIGSFNKHKALIIIDGLNELFIAQGIEDSSIENFFNNLSNSLREYPDTIIILTSRHNYFLQDQILENNMLVLQLSTFTKEQQKKWLECYIKFKNGISLTPDQLSENIHDNSKAQWSYLREIINQPILLQLITHRFEKSSKNRSNIYQGIFDKLISRDWGSFKQLKRFRRINNEIVRNYIRYIAYRIHTSQNDSISLEVIKDIEETDEFIRKGKLRREFSNTNDAIKDILTLFYFQEVNSHEGEINIKFLHDLVQEYLSAEYVYDKLKNTFLSSQTWKEALCDLQRLLIENIFTESMLDCLNEVINNDTDTIAKKELFVKLTEFLPYFLQRGFLVKYLAKNSSSFPFDDSTNGFHSYWHILQTLRRSENLEFSSLQSTDEFIRLVLAERNRIHDRQLFLDGLSLVGINLAGANLDAVRFDNSNLDSANFERTSLVETSFVDSELVEAKFNNAKFEAAVLDGAKLEGTEFYYANLHGTYFLRANLKQAIFDEANLVGVKFDNAILRETSFVGAKLTNTSFVGAKLIGANLSNTQGITASQLKDANTLYHTEGIPDDIKEDLESSNPQLFQEPNLLEEEE